MSEVTAKVSLVSCSPDPEQIIATAAKLCYASDTEHLIEKAGEDADAFVRRLREMGHMSPVEHAVFTFYIEGISRAMTHQLVRHRLASYSQRSQRYVVHDEFDYVVPPQVHGKQVNVDGKTVDATEFYRETMDIIAERYGKLNDVLGRKGESSNEDARYLLPNACETKMFMTMNARQLLHFFEERLCYRAQWEIRAVAEKMLRMAKESCPAVFIGAGPKCIRAGRCPEGVMTCGKYTEVKAFYSD